MNSKWTHTGMRIFQLLVATAVVVVAIRLFDWKRVAALLRQSDLRYVAAAFAIVWMCMILSAARLKAVINIGYSVPLTRTMYAGMAGKIYGYFVPGSIGTYFGTIAAIHEHTGNALAISLLFGAERIVSLVAVLALICLSFPFVTSLLPHALPYIIGGSMLMVCLFTVSAWIVATNRQFKRLYACIARHPRAQRLMTVIDYLKARPVDAVKKTLWLAFFYSIVLNLSIAAGNYCLLKAVGANAGLLYIVAVTPLCSLFLMVPISINGIGVREACFYFLLSHYSVPAEQVIAFNLIGYIIDFIVLITAGCWMATTAMKKRRSP